MKLQLAPSQIPNLDDLTYPLWGSFKIDGIRGMYDPTTRSFMTRSWKPHPNEHIQRFGARFFDDDSLNQEMVDGEFWSPSTPFNELSGILRSHSKSLPSDLQFLVFDHLLFWDGRIQNADVNYRERYDEYLRPWATREISGVLRKTLKQVVVADADAAGELYERALDEGFEGIMLRNPDRPYKFGRATFKEGLIYKVKPFDNLSAVIIGFEQQKALINAETRERDVNGYVKRTHKAEHFVLVESMGSLRVRDDKGREFHLGWGKGYTPADRAKLWEERNTLIGKHVEVRYFDHGEHKNPRMPQLIGFRPDLD